MHGETIKIQLFIRLIFTLFNKFYNEITSRGRDIFPKIMKESMGVFFLNIFRIMYRSDDDLM